MRKYGYIDAHPSCSELNIYTSTCKCEILPSHSKNSSTFVQVEHNMDVKCRGVENKPI